MTAALSAAREGAGRLVVIEGPAGIGKSRLLAAARILGARTGMRVLHGRGAEIERDFPYALARQLVEPATRQPGPSEYDEPDPSPETGDRSFATMHGLFRSVVRLSDERPLLVAVDDVHWADAPSLRFLAYLARRLHTVPAVVALACRPEEPNSDRLLLAQLATDPETVRLAPAPLTFAATVPIVRSALGEGADPGFVSACHRATGGNPLLLGELMRALRDEEVAPVAAQIERVLEIGPRAVGRAVEIRLARLSAPVGRFARATALLGDGAPLRLVARLAGLEEPIAADAAALLESLEILRSGDGIEFVHPLVRTAVLAGLAPSEASAAHARAAEILRAAGAPAERIAGHLVHAPATGDPGRVVTLREAASRALAAGDSRTAVSYLRRALEEPPPDDELTRVLVELGGAETLIDGPASAEHLGQAARRISDPSLRAPVCERLARALFFGRRHEESVNVASTAIEDLGGRHPDLELRLHADILHAALMDPALRASGEGLAQRSGRASGGGVGRKSIAALLGYDGARAGRPEGVAQAREGLAGGVLVREDNGGGPMMLAAYTLALADDHDGLTTCEHGLTRAEQHGSLFAYTANKLFRGKARQLTGDLAGAVDDMAEALDAAESYGFGIGAWAAGHLCDALLDRGDVERAGQVLEAAGPLDDPPGDAHTHASADALGKLLLAQGQARPALDATLDAARRFEALGGRNPAFMAWRSRAAECLRRLGEDEEERRRLVGEELDLARRFGAPRALGHALRAAAADQAGDRRLDLLQQAVTVLERSPARLELAGALVDLGAALRRRGHRVEGRRRLRAGMRLAQSCGAEPLERRAHDELLAAGAKPRRLALEGAGALTPAERRVADLAAAGESNRTIAQRLYLSPKTVETHLSHAYRKLEIRSRSQLRRALERRP